MLFSSGWLIHGQAKQVNSSLLVCLVFVSFATTAEEVREPGEGTRPALLMPRCLFCVLLHALPCYSQDWSRRGSRAPSCPTGGKTTFSSPHGSCASLGVLQMAKILQCWQCCMYQADGGPMWVPQRASALHYSRIFIYLFFPSENAEHSYLLVLGGRQNTIAIILFIQWEN